MRVEGINNWLFIKLVSREVNISHSFTEIKVLFRVINFLFVIDLSTECKIIKKYVYYIKRFTIFYKKY